MFFLSRHRLRQIYRAHRDAKPDLHPNAHSVRTQHEPWEEEFARAIHTYKIECRRPYPTWSEVLQILLALGYRRPSRWEEKTPPRRAAKADRLTRSELHAALLWVFNQLEQTCAVQDAEDAVGLNAHLRAVWGARDAVNELFAAREEIASTKGTKKHEGIQGCATVGAGMA
jgi:hypothetical protein